MPIKSLSICPSFCWHCPTFIKALPKILFPYRTINIKEFIKKIRETFLKVYSKTGFILRTVSRARAKIISRFDHIDANIFRIAQPVGFFLINFFKEKILDSIPYKKLNTNQFQFSLFQLSVNDKQKNYELLNSFRCSCSQSS